MPTKPVGPVTIYDQDWDDERQQYVSSRKRSLPLGPNHPHYPNKAERAELKRLMREGQCSEEEVRASHGNRVLLAKAAKSPMQKGSTDRQALKAKRIDRARAKRLGIEVWQLKDEDRYAPPKGRWW